jgi:hypothetical protein
VLALSVEKLGFKLSEPPLSAPVLLHHALRYAIASGPQQRSDYFKAVLEIADLDVVRREIAQLSGALTDSPDPLIGRLTELATIPLFASHARAMQRTGTTLETVERHLLAALGLALEQAGVHEPDADIEGRATALNGMLAQSQEAAFPLAAFRTGQVADVNEEAPGLEGFAAYAAALAVIEGDVARLAPVFSSILALPEVAEAVSAIDCPVCMTPAALTLERLLVLRSELTRGEEMETAARAAMESVSRLRAELERTRDIARRAVAPAAQWSSAERQERRNACVVLGASAELFDAAHASVTITTERAERVLESAMALQAEVDAAAASITARGALTLDGLIALVGSYRSSVEGLGAARRDQSGSGRALAAALQPLLEARAGQPGWRALAALVEGCQDLVTEVRKAQALSAVRKRLEVGGKAIEAAAQAVLDRRFSAMSDEILRWWRTLRPDEPVVFGGIRRRATGRRYLDLKAALRTAETAPAVTRDAVAVFSDSQLNALGLSMFLARAVMEGSPLVVLDDPVALGDSDHRVTFAYRTVEALLGAGMQVIFTTFDEIVSTNTSGRYWHQGLDEFEVSLEDAVVGAVVTKTSDSIEALLTKARLIVKVPTVVERRGCAQLIRRTAEKLAKLVIRAGKERESGKESAWSEYIGKNLSTLIEMAKPYMSGGAEEVGKWQAIRRLTNPGSHDNPTPDNAALKQALDNVSELQKLHAREIRGLERKMDAASAG